MEFKVGDQNQQLNNHIRNTHKQSKSRVRKAREIKVCAISMSFIANSSDERGKGMKEMIKRKPWLTLRPRWIGSRHGSRGASYALKEVG
jgi:hypothetical protein